MTPDQRLEAFRAFVAKSPGDAFARYSLAMALQATGRGEEAAAELQELRRLNPAYVPAYLVLGKTLETLGRDAEALRAYEDGIAAATGAKNTHARDQLEQALEALRARGAPR